MTALGCLLFWKAPQAHDLFLEFALSGSLPASLAGALDPDFLVHAAYAIRHMVAFVIVLILFWAVPTHYAARLLLDTDQRLHDLVQHQPDDQRECLTGIMDCVPRILGTLTFVAVLFGIWRSYDNVPLLDERGISRAAEISLLFLAFLVVVGWVCFRAYLVRRSRVASRFILPMITPFSNALAPFWRRVWPGFREPAGAEDGEAGRDLGRLLFTVAFVIFVLVFLFGADSAAAAFPRAMAVPFILGGWMPFLTYLSAAGRQRRAPLILGLFVAVSLLALLIGDNHSVRRINANAQAGRTVDTSMMRLEGAVKLWMDENCVASTAAGQTKQNCPRPIIVASAGGASRAAFFMSSVIGRLMIEAPNHDLTANDIRKRLFAISSVSGSSLGAVMVTAALNAKKDAATQPCEPAAIPLWYGERVGNWQDCFEALTSGDFLSPVFFGFAFNDMFPFAWRDRAAVLEDSWSERFDAVVTKADEVGDGLTCKGLDCPFLTLRPRPSHWIPLLVLNGTSEATGGRIVTTLLNSTYTPSSPCPTKPGWDGPCYVFTEADHFHDLLASEYDSALDSVTGAIERLFLKFLYRRTPLDDIRLSTAAHNSARFPFVSPPGTVRSNAFQQVIDRIVDGGYFENYGVISANELALAIHAVNPDLAPLVIVISNDPDDLLDPRSDWDRTSPNRIPAFAVAATQRTLQQINQYGAQRSKTRARVSGSEPLTDVLTTITAFANAWPAHGTLAVEDFRSWMHQTNKRCPVQLVHIRVWPQQLATGEISSRAVSMSWWLSPQVQRHLHQQFEDTKNENGNRPRFTAIWSALSRDGGCAASPAQP